MIPIERQTNMLPHIRQPNGLRFARARDRWAAIQQLLNQWRSSQEDLALQAEKRILIDNVLLVALRPLFLGVAIVIFGATLFRMSTVPFGLGVLTFSIGLTICGVFLATRRFLVQGRVPANWAHPLAAMLSTIGYLFLLYNLIFRQDTFAELRFVGLSLLIIMTGALFLHLRWLFGMMALIFASWTAVNLMLGLNLGWSVYLILYPIIGIAALANFAARRQAICRMIDAQMKNDLHSAQLAEALERAHLSEAQLKTERDLADQVVDSMGQGLALLDSDGRFEYANPAAERLLGRSAAQLIGQVAEDFLQCRDTGQTEQPSAGQNLFAAPLEPLEVVIDHEDGAAFSVLVAAATRAGGGTILTLTDLTLRKQFEAKLTRLAHFDALTGLANRTQFTERLEALGAPGRAEAARVAVLFIDLDRFKRINDTMGHAVGDRVLVEAARRIENCIRGDDIAARFGGDEFVVLLLDIEDEHAAVEVAERIADRIRAPFALPDGMQRLSGSIGISIGLAPDIDAEVLINQADTAMYEAKRNRLTNSTVYHPDMRMRVQLIA